MYIVGNGEDCNGIGREKERRGGKGKTKETGALLDLISCFLRKLKMLDMQ